MDEPGFTLGFELASQVADVDLQRVGGSREVVTPDLLQNLVAFEHLPRVPHEQLEKVKLGTGQGDRPSAAPYLTGAQIEHKIGELQLLCGVRPGKGPPQQRAQTRQQFIEGE